MRFRFVGEDGVMKGGVAIPEQSKRETDKLACAWMLRTWNPRPLGAERVGRRRGNRQILGSTSVEAAHYSPPFKQAGRGGGKVVGMDSSEGGVCKKGTESCRWCPLLVVSRPARLTAGLQSEKAGEGLQARQQTKYNFICCNQCVITSATGPVQQATCGSVRPSCVLRQITPRQARGECGRQRLW